jgi:ubiquinone/menaquinone biosynthesis C-methylase UbiE
MPMTELTQTPLVPSPVQIIDTVMNYRASKVLLVAISYDVFSALDRDGADADDVSSRLHTDPRATRLLLDALLSLGYAAKRDGRFVNTPLSAAYLVKGRPGYLGNNLKYQEMIWDAWSDLKNVLKRGRPERGLDRWLEDAEFTHNYIEGMANIAKGPSREIVSIWGNDPPRSLLDVGAGPGVYATAFLDKFPSAKATLLDLPSTIAVTKDLLKDSPHLNRIAFAAGDYHCAPFGVGAHDLVIMSHITHDEGDMENRALIKKAFAALKPGGKLLVHDFMSTDGKMPTPFESLFSIHMLVYTQKGQVYSSDTYKSWLNDAGFNTFVLHDIAQGLPNSSKVLIGTR